MDDKRYAMIPTAYLWRVHAIQGASSNYFRTPRKDKHDIKRLLRHKGHSRNCALDDVSIAKDPHIPEHLEYLDLVACSP